MGNEATAGRAENQRAAVWKRGIGAIKKRFTPPAPRQFFFCSTARLLKIFQGSNKRHWQASERLGVVPPGRRSSASTSLATPFWLHAGFLASKESHRSRYNTSAAARPQPPPHPTHPPSAAPSKGKLAQHLSPGERGCLRSCVFEARRLFFPDGGVLLKPRLHSPEWGPAQCKMSYSHCADQHAPWALDVPITFNGAFFGKRSWKLLLCPGDCVLFPSLRLLLFLFSIRRGHYSSYYCSSEFLITTTRWQKGVGGKTGSYIIIA